ncbi:hypothetical protein N183_34905 [Sinorhizobium sp. Sb3]|uniref:hypothetical protein n=1 Tax=Sinorhizobium sp. Sb3 TaxID=1358417 RepID=UPI00072AEF3E|nr:hypothetical protein [Sinorhizobium sp. Sb3]KSV64559.1 hypothetical protein N183_34905 [Sinorhizobium sp. Sb3]
MDHAGEEDEEARPVKRRKITALADGEEYQSASNGTSRVKVRRLSAASGEDLFDLSTSNSSSRIQVDPLESAFEGDDLFSGLSEADLAEIDRIVAAAANGQGHQATSTASLRVEGGRSDNVFKDDDSFSDISDSALSEIDRILARTRDPQQNADNLFACDELSDLSEVELHGADYVKGSVDRQGGQSFSTRSADQKARNRRLARSVYDGPNTWPPPHDLGVYSHGHAVTAAEYKVYLTKVGLHHNLFYNAIGGRASRSSWMGKFPYDKEHLGEGNYSEGNIFGRPPSPDTWPFLAFDDDPMFRSGAYKLLEGSGVCVQSRFCSNNGKRTARVYIELSVHQADKLALDEQRENLSVKRRSEIVKKIEVLNPPPSSFRKHVIEARSNLRLNDEGLRRVLRSIHDDGFCADYIKAELQPFLRGDDQQQNLRGAMGKLVDGDAPLFWKFDESLPLFLLKGERTLIEGEKAVLPPPSKLCLAVNYEEHQRPTYVRLNAHQATQLSRQEQCFLGLRPNWITSSMSSLELYKFGLLPPGSRALENALTSDHEIREYFEKYPLKRLSREYKGTENEPSSRSRQPIAEQQPPQKYDARSRERSPHTR